MIPAYQARGEGNKKIQTVPLPFCEVVTRDVAQLNRELRGAVKPANKRMSAEEAKKHFQLIHILRLARDEHSMKEIAEEEGVSISFVQGIVGVEFRAKRTEEKNARLERYRQLRAEGLSYKRIGELEGISRQAVEQILAEDRR